MSVPVHKRTPCKFEVVLKAKELAKHTLNKCCNEKHFPPNYRDALTNDLIWTAKDIFANVYRANNVLVRKPADLDRRRRLQESAADECNSLLMHVELAQAVFHLPLGSVAHWTDMILTERSMIRKWIESDAERYKELANS